MKKKFLCMLLAGTLALSFAACGKKGDADPTPTPGSGQENPSPSNEPSPEPTQAVEADFSVKELTQGIVDKAVNIALMEGGETELTELYGIEASKVAEYAIMVPLMNVQATELAMFKAASAEDVDAILAGINTRIAALEATWGQYLQDQMELVEARKVLKQGNYIFFIIAEEDVSAYAENVFLRKFDPSIEEYVLVRKFDRVDNGTLKAISESGLTVEMEEEGTTYVFECTYSSDYFYAEGELSDYAVNDKVCVVFETEVKESEGTMQAVLTYLGPVSE